MSRTNYVRELVQSRLTEKTFTEKHAIKNVSYEIADEKDMFPHIVFEFDAVNLGDLHRKDLSLIIDIYDRSDNADRVEAIADDVEDMFDCKNLPQDAILPTFFLENRRPVKDEDKRIRHRQIEIIVQNYER